MLSQLKEEMGIVMLQVLEPYAQQGGLFVLNHYIVFLPAMTMHILLLWETGVHETSNTEMRRQGFWGCGVKCSPSTFFSVLSCLR